MCMVNLLSLLPGLRVFCCCRAVVVALVTGHGMDEKGCAEFCPTSHHIEANGALHSTAQLYGDAGTLWGCADKASVVVGMG